MVFVSIITLFGLGLVAAILLSIASRVFYVKEDPRVEAVLEVLPGQQMLRRRCRYGHRRGRADRQDRGRGGTPVLAAAL